MFILSSDKKNQALEKARLESYMITYQKYFDNPVTGVSYKRIDFRFKVEHGGNPRDIIAVNWVKGEIKTEKNGYDTVRRIGRAEKATYDKYVIDSIDRDPRWGSDNKINKGLTYLDDLGIASWSDKPGQKIGTRLDPANGKLTFDMDFIMALYYDNNFPSTYSQYGTVMPLRKIPWKCKINAVYNSTTRKFDITHPGDENVKVMIEHE